jgi:hypothetical protein
MPPENLNSIKSDFLIKIFSQILNDVANYSSAELLRSFRRTLQALQLTASFTYKIKGNGIYIDKK